MNVLLIDHGGREIGPLMRAFAKEGVVASWISSEIYRVSHMVHDLKFDSFIVNLKAGSACGPKLLKRLRESNPRALILGVAEAAKQGERWVQSCLALGADAVLQPPGDIQGVLDAFLKAREVKREQQRFLAKAANVEKLCVRAFGDWSGSR